MPKYGAILNPPDSSKLTERYFDLYDKIDEILEWADETGWYDTTFVLSLQEQLEERGDLTNNQESSLCDIISKFITRGDQY